MSKSTTDTEEAKHTEPKATFPICPGLTSEVWKHFVRDPEAPHRKATCSHCNIVVNTFGNTSGMLSHLKHNHNIILKSTHTSQETHKGHNNYTGDGSEKCKFCQKW
mgnify:CR=1 FL=1